MAKKTFYSIRGVELAVRDEYKEEVKKYTDRISLKNDVHFLKGGYINYEGYLVENAKMFRIEHRGDALFVINLEKLIIETYVVKYAYESGSLMKIIFSDKDKNKDYIPTNKDVSALIYFSSRLIEDLKKRGLHGCIVEGRKSTSGLVFTNINDAIDALNRFKNHQAFIYLKVGDSIYQFDREEKKIKERKVLDITFVEGKNNQSKMEITLDGDNAFMTLIFGKSRYSSKASTFTDSKFSCFTKGNGCWEYRSDGFYLDKEEAEKALKAATKERKKKEDMVASLLGTEIKFKDNKGNILHYGDKVAYVHSTGNHWGLKQDISLGIIVGESKSTITVFDAEEQREIREKRKKWNEENKKKGYKEYLDDPKDGFHSIANVKILLFESYKK